MQDKPTIIIGTRGSELALWQAYFTQARLAEVGYNAELKIIKTTGDQIQHLSFDKLEGKGFFTKEIEDALLQGEIDMAVHSMKDMPTTQPDGLMLAGVSYRETPSDCLLIHPSAFDPTLPLKLKKGAKVGTSSSRRKAQLLDIRPDLELCDIRGNVPTRANKAKTAELDAVMLAAAGLNRLELSLDGVELVQLSPKEFIPAPAQGVLAWQVRREDMAMRQVIQKIHKKETVRVTNIERATLKLLGGGCQIPFGLYCEQDAAGNFHAFAAYAEAWDAPLKRFRLSSSTSANMPKRILEGLGLA